MPSISISTLVTGLKNLRITSYPKNGLDDPNGNPDRVQLPSYMKDVYGYGTNPLATVEHKTSPILSFAVQLANNQNYYGDMIRNKNDSAGKQLQQLGLYAAQQVLPFSVESLSRQAAAEGSSSNKAESFFGFTKAPAVIIRNSEQNDLLSRIENAKGAFAPRTPEQVAQTQAKTQLKQKAEQAFQDIQRASPQDAVKELKDIQTNQPDLAKELDSIIKDEAKGITYTDRLIRQLPDIDRAQYIYEKISQMSDPLSKADYIQELADKGLVTDKVAGYIADKLK